MLSQHHKGHRGTLKICEALRFIIKRGSKKERKKNAGKCCATGNGEERWTGMSDILIQQARVQQPERQRCLQGEEKVIDTEIDNHNNNCSVERR